MLNQITLVGRISNNVELKEDRSNKKYCNLIIATTRTYKNVDGIYESDFISCKLYDGIARNAASYCKRGDLVGVKGRLQKGEGDRNMTIIAEKITFLSCTQPD